MTATVDIITEAQKDALIVPNKALRFRPASAEEGMRRGPPMPLLGTGARKGGQGSARDRGASGKLGSFGASEGVIWILAGGQPSPVKVTKLATDGSETAVRGKGIAEGTEVIVELTEGLEG
jgi:HlyD family secretion protein